METQWAIELNLKKFSLSFFYTHLNVAIKSHPIIQTHIKCENYVSMACHNASWDHKLIDNFSLISIVYAVRYIELKSIKQIKWIKRAKKKEMLNKKKNLDWSCI